ENNSTIDSLIFNGFSVVQGSDAAPLCLVNIGSGSVGDFVLNSVNTRGIPAPVSGNGFSGVGSVLGTGVLETGWEFPDATMADGVPYISASTGRPSIKINGVVEPYT